MSCKIIATLNSGEMDPIVTLPLGVKGAIAYDHKTRPWMEVQNFFHRRKCQREVFLGSHAADDQEHRILGIGTPRGAQFIIAMSRRKQLGIDTAT